MLLDVEGSELMKKFKVPILDLNSLEILMKQNEKTCIYSPKEGSDEVTARMLIHCPNHPAEATLIGFREGEPGIVLFCRRCKEPFYGVSMKQSSNHSSVAVTGDISNFLLGDKAEEIMELAEKGGPEALAEFVMNQMKNNPSMFHNMAQASSPLPTMEKVDLEEVLDENTPSSIDALCRSLDEANHIVSFGLQKITDREKKASSKKSNNQSSRKKRFDSDSSDDPS